MALPRSLPTGFISNSAPANPPTTTIKDTATMATSSTTSASSGFMNFIKTILLPILIALLLYLLLFHALLPLYRRHRARYAQYLPLPLSSLPPSLQPSSVRSRLSSTLLRIFLPSTWAFSHHRHASPHSNSSSTRPGVNRRPSIPSTISEEEDSSSFDNASDRFSDDHGEAMVGFDMMSIQIQNRRRRDGMERQVARGILAAREMNAAAFDEPPPERRLSRELEEVFRDDSDDDDDEDQTHRITVGRRSLSTVTRQ